jgi:hypothetical protein
MNTALRKNPGVTKPSLILAVLDALLPHFWQRNVLSLIKRSALHAYIYLRKFSVTPDYVTSSTACMRSYIDRV